MVWRLDRLGRSIRHLIDQLQALADRGVGFRSLQDTIDTTSPGGRPSSLFADQVKAARRMHEQKDMTVAQIGDGLGVSRTTIYRTLNRQPAMSPPRQAPPTRTAGPTHRTDRDT